MIDREKLRERADEYVLGLLDPAEEAELAEAMRRDAAVRSAVAASRDRFVELDLATEPAPVSEALWDRIDSRLDEKPGDAEDSGAATTEASRAGPPAAANDNTAERWRRRGLAAMAASVLFAVALGWSLLTRPEPQVIAVLLNDAGEPLALVEDFGGSRAKVTPLVDISVPAGRTMQVWTKPSDEIGPVSLGLLAAPSASVLVGPELPTPRENQLYEITFEAEGGSPTGLPTGPILAKGFAAAPR